MDSSAEKPPPLLPGWRFPLPPVFSKFARSQFGSTRNKSNCRLATRWEIIFEWSSSETARRASFSTDDEDIAMAFNTSVEGNGFTVRRPTR